jgi:hypothetical protein
MKEAMGVVAEVVGAVEVDIVRDSTAAESNDDVAITLGDSAVSEHSLLLFDLYDLSQGVILTSKHNESPVRINSTR